MTVNDSDLADFIDDAVLERRTKVMFLRNAGATLSAIAREVGVSVATVRKDLMIVRRDINNEQPEDVIARHRAVIFDIQRANYPAMMRGDRDAAATILRALDREAKLLGLDAPTRVLAGVSDVEFANEAARLIERIQQLDPTTLKELERAHHTSTDIIDATVEPAPPPDAAVAGVDEPPGQPGGDTGPGDDPDDAGRPGPPRQQPAADPTAATATACGPADLPGAVIDATDDDWSNIED
ncbi:Rnase E [Mycobacterium phage Saguaro]|uniref:Helix-turn-helix DNA-binding domain protein n=1 Tax=Mycobacterium phage Saguaro TaxID=2315616 RepID=A0A386KCX4_9CAUD|nr:Rnase E [Mycobacterium phage Saguaro]AYD82060.1 helix-turn-helix DNA-binding domain protein [Mycobacterium phage Saguaro]